MKKQHTLALLLLAGLALSACSSDDDAVQSEPQSPNEVKTYHATTVLSLGGDTRALSLDGTTLNATWATSEKVYVLKEGTSTGSMSPTTSGSATADLAGELTGSFAAGNSVTLRFPRAEVSYTGQDGTLETIAEKYDYAELTTTVKTVSGSNITIGNGVLENKQAIVKLTFSQAISNLAISSSALAYPVTVKPAPNSTVLYLALPIQTSGAATYTFTVINGDKYCSVTKSYTLENGNFYGATLTLSNWEDAYVEIGDIKWAKMNIGAASETDYGSYFAWGETEEKSQYLWATYTFNPIGDGETFTKYNSTDGKTTLEAGDDAATANWGADWRMPTLDDFFGTLLNNTTHEWTTINGVNGMKFTSTSDDTKYIFLPAAGLFNKYGYRNTYFYWSSSLDLYHLYYCGRRLYFESSGFCSMANGDCSRYCGLLVRAVKSN